MWSLWKERNERIFKGGENSEKEVKNLIILRLCWWLKSWEFPFPYSPEEVLRNPKCLKWRDSTSAQMLKSKPILQWEAPSPFMLKWNVDASYDSNLGRAAIGGVLRDEKGNFLCLFSCPIPPMDINAAEVIAIHMETQISLNNERFKTHQIMIESDSKNALLWCSKDKGGPWNLNFIRSAPKNGLNVSISHRGRSSNIVADTFAKQGLTRNSDFVAWL